VIPAKGRSGSSVGRLILCFLFFLGSFCFRPRVFTRRILGDLMAGVGACFLNCKVYECNDNVFCGGGYQCL